MAFVLNIGIVLSFFLGILLLLKKDKALTDNILAIWLISIGIHLTNFLLNYNGYWEIYPHLIGIAVPFPFLYGPFLYLYVLYSTTGKKHLNKTDYLHFAPALITYLYMIPFYFTYSTEEKVQVDKGLINDFSLFSNIILIGFILSGISYSVLSYLKLEERKKVFENKFSNRDRINMSWLRYSILGIVLVFITATVVIVLREVFGFQFSFDADILFYSIIVGFVVYIGFSGIRQQDLFSNTAIKEEDENKMHDLESKPNNLVKKKSYRQLAAIMFTDMEGYTALMQTDEKKALQARDKHRRIFNLTTEKYDGKILQYFGDGTLSIFKSAIEAVQCAIDMQNDLLKEPQVPVRIGIHTGDVIYSEEDVIGDGVNVASRIESLAVAGSIFISYKVYDDIKNQEAIKTKFLDQYQLKNVMSPIGVYAITNEGLVVPALEDIEGKTENR